MLHSLFLSLSSVSLSICLLGKYKWITNNSEDISPVCALLQSKLLPDQIKLPVYFHVLKMILPQPVAFNCFLDIIVQSEVAER